ncbi:SOS response-associated peptidase [Candidatus Lucifugimonas marina]|uniref:Abasic site processing protein n=1 Tax=Candidatus Lucifugimonas marina TaxID=3038979 RepID=A0AAJ5ZDA8_9CHLR|nr:SOS response-associated peptidase [SAR202 cluster bacterium JH702]MDG0868702.1 SOS response-associated peptidase [SAR202 cluster bacterium JH639]WFG35334.1 SOS response-associated peptidase [SAR202 cluster bacterium JH545]WFG39282.1 SOS response-associated peptidase [SAR202 cluster bacterium JH1073]
MCGAFVYVYVGGVRYQLMGSGVERAGIAELIASRPDLGSRFNIRPTQDIVTIVNEDGRPVAKPMRWGLIPSWAKPDKLPRSTFNAREDRLSESGMWRGPFARSRAVVPANGFFEWKKTDGSKQPMYITPKEGEILRFAAIYDTWINEHGETVDSCAIVTTAANDFMSSIHDRMPAILDEESIALWLDPNTSKDENLQPILMPESNDQLQAIPVSTRVNSDKNDDAGLILEVAADQPTDANGQLGLFDTPNDH